MRPVQVTESQIVDAGRQLAGEGRAVTANALRNKVGAGNPRRLMTVWQRLTGDCPQSCQSLALPTFDLPTAAVQPQEPTEAGAAIKVQELMSQLAEAQRRLELEMQRVAQLEITVNAVTDQLNNYKQQCISYETSAKHTQTRIADLTARIDEQRGELHRGSQARHALQQALTQIQGGQPAPK